MAYTINDFTAEQQNTLLRLLGEQKMGAKEIAQFMNLTTDRVFALGDLLRVRVPGTKKWTTQAINPGAYAKSNRNPPASIHEECQWIDGEPRKRKFCCKPTIRNSSWCDHHYRRVYV